MAIKKGPLGGSIESTEIANGAVVTDKLDSNAVTPAKLADTLDLSSKTVTLSPTTTGLGMTITSLAYPADDTAVDTASPGTVTIIGTGFEAGSLVYVDSVSNANSASSVVIVGSTQITFTPPAKAAATYNVWVVGPTGRIAILANGIQYSGTPSWSGQSTSLNSGAAVSIQLSASGDTPLVYSLVSGTLPTGVTLSSTGLISGTATGLSTNTTFTNIVVKAQDPQNQDASITLSLSITVQHQISRSLRFNSSDDAYLSRTPASAGNRRTWTWSGWVKRSALDSQINGQVLFNTQGNSTSTNFIFQFDDGNGTNGADTCLALHTYDGDVFTTTSLYRDISAWYHVVLAIDTTQATSGNRIKLYVNGEEVTLNQSTNWPALNFEFGINTTQQHGIGKHLNFSNYNLDGYMTEINFVDGQQLTPASFGEPDEDTGVWIPKSYAGSYGTNGFYLNFSDNSNNTAATLGKDYSGNSNNWTPNNFSVTTNSDSVVDSPTSYGTDTGVGGEVRGNYCTQNPLDRLSNNCLYSNGNLGLEGSNESFPGSKATFALTSGKWYWETTITLKNNSPIVGICRNDYFSGGTGRIMYRSDGSYLTADGGEFTVPDTFTTGDIIGVSLDLDDTNGKIRFYKNGVQQTAVAALDSVKSALSISTVGGVFPYTQLYTGDKVDLNFGQRPFTHAAPAGFKCLTVQNLPEPTIADASDHFNTVLYTGDGTSSRSITGVGFQPDIVWYKSRSNAVSHRLFDAVRGANKELIPNASASEFTASNELLSFNSDGFTIGNEVATNGNGYTFVAWNWNAGGSTVTNTAGTIQSQVRANTTAGISIVTYTGNDTAGATVGHELGVAPSMIILKPRNLSSTNWIVYHKSLGYTKVLSLNSENAAGTDANFWNNTPTSSVFYLGSYGDVNSSSGSYVAYCFADVEGFSKFGSYTGNGDANGPFVYTGFRPAFVMIRYQSSANWTIVDNKRDVGNPTIRRLFPSNANAETTNVNNVDMLSNGFKLRVSGASDGGANASGGTYIYAAFAESPFKYAVAR